MSSPESLGIPSDDAGIIAYVEAPRSLKSPKLPILPPFFNTPTAFKFYSNLTGLLHERFLGSSPNGSGLAYAYNCWYGLIAQCGGRVCQGPNGFRLAGSMNNASFQFRTKCPCWKPFTTTLWEYTQLIFQTSPQWSLTIPIPVTALRLHLQ